MCCCWGLCCIIVWGDWSIDCGDCICICCWDGDCCIICCCCWEGDCRGCLNIGWGVDPLLPAAPIMAAARWELDDWEAGEGELSAIDGEFKEFMEGEFKAAKVGVDGWEVGYWEGPLVHPGGPPVCGAT